MRGKLFFVVCLCAAGCLPPDVKPVSVRDSRYIRAETLFLTGNYSEAYSILKRSAAGEYLPEYLLLKAKCSLSLKAFSRAADEFREAAGNARVLDQYVQARLGLADALYSSQRAYEQSSDLYAGLLEEYGERIPRSSVMIRYAHSLIRSGSRSRGKDVLQQVIQMYPGSSESSTARNLLEDADSDFYIQLGRFGKRVNAVSLRNRARAAGFRVRIEMDGGYYTVVTGYRRRFRLAQTDLERYRQAGFSEAFIKP